MGGAGAHSGIAPAPFGNCFRNKFRIGYEIHMHSINTLISYHSQVCAIIPTNTYTIHPYLLA